MTLYRLIPAAGDNVSEGDDHIRGIKNVLKTTFPSLDGAVTPSDTELNYMGGVTSAVQTQLDTISANNWVTNARMADDAITGAEIADDAINSEHYVDGSIDTAHIADDQVTYAKMQNVSATDRILGRDTSGAGVVEEITPANVRTMINVEDGADVTDTANVTSSGALMDSECTNLAAVKAINQGLATTDNVTHNNLTVSGDLTVSGTTTTVNTANLAVEDPLIALATGNSSADAVDIGLFGLYDTSGSQDLYGGIFRDANDSGKWKIFKDNQAAPTTTVDTSGTGYATGTLVADVEVPTGASATFADSSKAKFGTGSDMEIYHDGSDSYIVDTGTGNMVIKTDGNFYVQKESGSENIIRGDVDGAVTLYHDNSAKLATTAGGIAVTGNIYGTANIGLDGTDAISFSNGSHTSFTVNGNEEMRLEADGDLHVDGDVIAFSTTISDATLKYDINPVEFALDKINQLKGVSYKYKHNDRESAGLLAQDVEKVMPSAVKSKKVPLVTGDDKEYKTLNYDSMTAILVEAIKELTEKVKKLEGK
jgi:hypothetical protein